KRTPLRVRRKPVPARQTSSEGGPSYPASAALARSVLLALREEISSVRELLSADHVPHRILAISHLRAELREQVPGGAAYLDGDQRIERSVAEEDAKPLAVSLASRRNCGERENGVHEARLRQRR